MKTLILLLILGMTGCVTAPTTRFVWDVKDQAKFNEDWDRCTSLARAYQYGEDFRTQCMVTRGNNIKTEVVGN